MAKIPFIQAMAEQEEATNGKYTGTHWRDEYKNWGGVNMKVIETYSQGDYMEIEVMQCENCGRTTHIQSGGDIACCPCEFEDGG